eukprot:scaffold5.g723.t1
MRAAVAPGAIASLLLVFCYPVAAYHGGNSTRDGLLNLQAQIANWHSNTADLPGAEWNESPDPCNPVWKGVTCAAGNVTGLDLSDLGLEGNLPPAMHELAQLNVLALGGNQLSGTLNSLTGRDGAIQRAVLNVSHNQIHGTIPAIWHSAELSQIDISFNLLTGTVPVVWGQWRGPDMPSAFPNLILLALEGNTLSGKRYLPLSPGAFNSSLVVTSSPGNPGLVGGLGPPSKDLATVTSALLSLPRATPNWLAATAPLPGAKWAAGADPCDPRWKGLTCDGGLPTQLSLPGLGLQGLLPSQLCYVGSMQAVDLSGNAYQGSVPSQWLEPTSFADSLATLQLAANQLSGDAAALAPARGALPGLLSYNVSRNGFSGPLSNAWASPATQQLDVSFNSLTGTVPTVWGLPRRNSNASAFPQLQLLALQGNQLSGPYGFPKGAFAPNFTLVVAPGNPSLVNDSEAAIASAKAALPAVLALPPTGGAAFALAMAAAAAAAVAAAAAAALLLVRRRRVRSEASGGRADAGAADPGKELIDSGTGAPSSRRGPPGDLDSLEKGGPSSSLGKLSASAGASAGVAAWRSSQSSGATGTGRSSSEDGGSRLLDSRLLDATDLSKLPASWNTLKPDDLEFVWLAKYCFTPVAVKLLQVKSPTASATQQQRRLLADLQKEAGIMQSLRHPSICQYIGVCLKPPAVIMEYCARRSVDTLLEKGRDCALFARNLSWVRLLTFAFDACKGMTFLHSKSIVHRDLKSANLLVDSNWRVKVADFNMSRNLETVAVASTLCITNPRWLSPEVLSGRRADLASDVWSFGTVMWELMTWQLPFDKVNLFQIIAIVQAAAAVQSDPLPVPSAEGLPAGPLASYDAYCALMRARRWFVAVVLVHFGSGTVVGKPACWHPDPAQRPTMDAVAGRLQAILSAEARRGGETLSQRHLALASPLPSQRLSEGGMLSNRRGSAASPAPTRVPRGGSGGGPPSPPTGMPPPRAGSPAPPGAAEAGGAGEELGRGLDRVVTISQWDSIGAAAASPFAALCSLAHGESGRLPDAE